MKRNPRKVKWTKAFRKAAGKEMTMVTACSSIAKALHAHIWDLEKSQDSTIEFEKRRKTAEKELNNKIEQRKREVREQRERERREAAEAERRAREEEERLREEEEQKAREEQEKRERMEKQRAERLRQQEYVQSHRSFRDMQ